MKALHLYNTRMLASIKTLVESIDKRLQKLESAGPNTSSFIFEPVKNEEDYKTAQRRNERR